jgi:hypothetical protein
LKGIDAVEQAIEEDKRLWNRSEEKRQIQQYMNSRGRFINKLLASNEEDPVAQYNDILENLQSVMNDISNRPAMKGEKFINLDCSKLKNSLLDHVNEIQQMIFTNLVREAKRDLNSLLDEWTSINDTLRKPANEFPTLKTNKALYDDVLAKMPQYDAAREPIRIKFKFIQQREEDIQNNELTEDDKANLGLLDEKFQEFQDNLDECQKTIKRCQALLRKDVEDQMEDFKKDCVDLKNAFRQNAPTSYDKENKAKAEDNVRSFEKLGDYKNQTIFLRGREEELKFGLDIFDLEQGSYPEIVQVEKEIEFLNDMWSIKRDWDIKWDELKEVQFYKLPV